MEWWIPIFLLVALLYSMVGHGGASGYLALMSLLNFSVYTIRATALVLNLFVSLISFIAFARAGHFKVRLFWPFAITSVPMAWLGGTIEVNEQYFKIILGIFLLIATARMTGIFFKARIQQRPFSIPLALLIGACLGFFSGLIGIGGGIILSPILLLLGWANVKTTAATSALFIFVNSLAGLIGMGMEGIGLNDNLDWLLAAVIIGGIIGALLGSTKYTASRVQKVLAVVLLLAAIKLLIIQ